MRGEASANYAFYASEAFYGDLVSHTFCSLHFVPCTVFWRNREAAGEDK